MLFRSSMAANQSGLAVRLIIHPVLAVCRSAGGLVGIKDHANARMESWQWLEIDRIENPERLADLERRIRASLGDVQSAVEDWERMTERALTLASATETARLPVAPDEQAEIGNLLNWMADHHFTFLGARYYRLLRGKTSDRLVEIGRAHV